MVFNNNYILKIIFVLSVSLTSGYEIDFEFDGWNRECYLYKPSCIPNEVPDDFEPVPLVFMFHGLGWRLHTN